MDILMHNRLIVDPQNVEIKITVCAGGMKVLEMNGYT